MYLTGGILLRSLGRKFKILNSQNVVCADGLCGVLWLDENTVIERGWSYVVTKENWQRYTAACLDAGLWSAWADAGALLVFVGDILKKSPENAAFICVNDDADAQSVMNTLARMYVEGMRWENQADQMISSGASMQELLEHAYRITRCPMILYRHDLSVAAKAGSDEKAAFIGQIPFWNMPQGEERMELVNAILHDPKFQRDLAQDAIYEGPEHILGYPSLSYNIRTNKQEMYILCMVGARCCPDMADEEILLMLSDKVKRLLKTVVRSSDGNREPLHVVFRQMLNNTMQDYAEISGQLTELGWKKEEYYLCLTMQMTYQKHPLLSETVICAYVEDRYPGCCSFLFQDHIVTYFKLNCESQADEIDSDMKTFVRDSLLKAGYSRIVKGHYYLRRLYQQAVIALGIGSSKTPHIWIHHFDGIVMEYMMDRIIAGMPSEMICHNGLLKLKKSDDENGTELVHTLAVWLENQGSATDAAKALFIHRSTFLYRMERIRSIMDSTLDDADERLYIGLSLKLIERM